MPVSKLTAKIYTRAGTRTEWKTYDSRDINGRPKAEKEFRDTLQPGDSIEFVSKRLGRGE